MKVISERQLCGFLKIEYARGKLDFRKRFWAKVRKTKTCWTWQGSCTRGGYGQFGLSRKVVYAHRVAFAIKHKRFLDPDKVLDHLCQNRICVNPDHLDEVTMRENLRRGSKFNGNKTHCKNGHLYSANNLYNTKNGWRVCRKCRLDTVKRWQGKQKEIYQ